MSKQTVLRIGFTIMALYLSAFAVLTLVFHVSIWDDRMVRLPLAGWGIVLLWAFIGFRYVRRGKDVKAK